MEQFKEKRTDLPFLCGPVTSNLGTALKRNKITMQAYHGRSMVGNHCHRYLKEEVYSDICDSVIRHTMRLSENITLHQAADDIVANFKQINGRFATVHQQISHCQPLSPILLTDIKASIELYMSSYRRLFPQIKIIPKQHILGCHVLPFMSKWLFGLGLPGEQAGEESHAFINILKSRTYGGPIRGKNCSIMVPP